MCLPPLTLTVKLFNRGIQLYLLMLAIIATVAAIWGTNRFILHNTTAGTGWPVIIGIAVSLVVIGLGVRYLYLPTDRGPLSEEYPW